MTPFMRALSRGRVAMALALAPTCDALALAPNGMSSLEWAIAAGCEAAARLLMDRSELAPRGPGGLDASAMADQFGMPGLAAELRARVLALRDKASLDELGSILAGSKGQPPRV